MTDLCESCANRPASSLIYFNDGGPTFAVCPACADCAAGLGCSIYELEPSA